MYELSVKVSLFDINHYDFIHEACPPCISACPKGGTRLPLNRGKSRIFQFIARQPIPIWWACCELFSFVHFGVSRKFCRHLVCSLSNAEGYGPSVAMSALNWLHAARFRQAGVPAFVSGADAGLPEWDTVPIVEAAFVATLMVELFETALELMQRKELSKQSPPSVLLDVVARVDEQSKSDEVRSDTEDDNASESGDVKGDDEKEESLVQRITTGYGAARAYALEKLSFGLAARLIDIAIFIT